MATTNDMVWIDDLDEEVCWRLVNSAVVGRVGFVLDGAPVILPSTSTWTGAHRDPDRADVAARGRRRRCRGRVRDRPRGRVRRDRLERAGPGLGEEVTAASERTELESLPLHPWAPGPRDRWIRIRPTQITGRAISRKRADTGPGGFVPYMPPD